MKLLLFILLSLFSGSLFAGQFICETVDAGNEAGPTLVLDDTTFYISTIDSSGNKTVVYNKETLCGVSLTSDIFKFFLSIKNSMKTNKRVNAEYDGYLLVKETLDGDYISSGQFEYDFLTKKGYFACHVQKKEFHYYEFKNCL